MRISFYSFKGKFMISAQIKRGETIFDVKKCLYGSEIGNLHIKAHINPTLLVVKN